ncbi:MAG: hypothetical protein HY554_16495 [Elusimicrobia bacterium]|nr:hypothetical protein [Elusimicrobiota bacterium]
MGLGLFRSRALATGLLLGASPAVAASIELSSATRRTLDVLAALPGDASVEARSALDRVFDGGGLGSPPAPQAVRAGPLAAAAPAPVRRAAFSFPVPLPELGARAAASLGAANEIATKGWRAMAANLLAGLRTHAPRALANAAWSLFTVGVTAGLAAADWLYAPSAAREATWVDLHRGEDGYGHVLVRAGAGGLLDRLVQVAGFTPSESVVLLKESASAAMTRLEREGLLVHELVHTRQWRDSYAADFLVDYLRLKDRYGYRDNPKEVEAYEVQRRFLCSQGDAAACGGELER